MDNFEIATRMAALAVIIDEQKVDVPNGWHWCFTLHVAAKEIAGDRVDELYGKED